MTALEWIAAILGAVAVGLGVRRSVWNFPIAIVSVVLVGMVVARERLYSDAILQGFFVVANLYGWANWRRAMARTGDVPVGTMTPRERIVWAVAWLAITLAWGGAMHRFTDADYPWWDAAIAIASVMAQVLMGRRRIENWPIWIVVDVASIPLYGVKGLWALAGLYLTYLLLSIWGWMDWRAAARRTAPALAA